MIRFYQKVFTNSERKKFNYIKKNEIITEYNLNKVKEKKENFLLDNGENLYFGPFIIDDVLNSESDSNDIISNNDEIKISKKFLKNMINNEKNENDNIENFENSNNNEYIYIINVLVSLKPHSELKGFLCPGNLEDNFFGIIPFDISMVEEIYDIPDKIKKDSKEKMDELGKK